MAGEAILSLARGLPRPLAVGFSGGADSVALLLALAEDDPHGLLAIHVHHGLRGDAADRDEAFCRDLCARLRIPLSVKRLRLPAGCGEEQARDARYAAFRKACAELGCDAVALAHHRDDQAETFLLRLLRGSGARGLSSLRAETERGDLRILRPFLSVTHADLCAWLTAHGQTWVEDETNAQPAYLRNRIRHELLPLMEELAPGAASRIAGTALTLQRDEDALTEWAERAAGLQSGMLWLRLKALDRCPDAVAVRALRLWWEQSPANCAAESSLSLAQTDALTALVRAAPGERCNLPSGWRAERGERYLHLLPPDGADAPPQIPRNGLHAGGLTLKLRPFAGETVDGKRSIVLPGDLLERCMVRTARPGDRIEPANSGHPRPLREFFRDRRVERPFRGWIPLLCLDRDVIMAPGLGSAALHCAGPGDTCVLTEWTGEMPWTDTEDD